MKLITLHQEAQKELSAWYEVARAADWSSLQDVRANFPSADKVGIFHILHDQLRLVTVVSWRSRRIYIKGLFTHRQYHREEWKKWV
jgi:mRNA interferase HigB